MTSPEDDLFARFRSDLQEFFGQSFANATQSDPLPDPPFDSLGFVLVTVWFEEHGSHVDEQYLTLLETFGDLFNLYEARIGQGTWDGK